MSNASRMGLWAICNGPDQSPLFPRTITSFRSTSIPDDTLARVEYSEKLSSKAVSPSNC